MLPGKKIGLPYILEALRRRAWHIAIPPAVALFVALLYSSTMPDLYQADMLIAVDPQRVPDSFVRSTVTLGTDRRLDALKIKVLSRTALEQLIEDFDLYPKQRQTMLVEDVVAILRANIDMVQEIPRPRWGEEPQPTAFRVQFTYWDPKKATDVTQKVGSLFVDQNIRDRGALAGATNRFLENQLAESREKLEAQERRLEDFRQRHGRELPTQMTSNLQALTLAQTRVQGIVESIARDRDRKLMLDRLYREAAAEPPVATATAAGQRTAGPGGPPVPLSVRQQLADARATLAALELRYKPDHPDVVRMRRLIADLEPKAATEAQLAASNAPSESIDAPIAEVDPARRERLRQMRAEIESLDRQMAFKESEEQRIRTEIAEYQRRVEAVPGLESEWVALTRDYDTQQIAYRDLLQKSNAAQLAANLEEENISERFRIVDPAVVPVRPLPSQRIRYNAAGLAIGLLIGLGIAALLELRDKSFRSEADVLDVLSLPVLATVPYIQTVSEKSRQQRRRLLVSLGGATCMAVAGYVAWSLKLWKSFL